MDAIADVLVVGSGCSGAIAAQTLAQGGARVTMVDVGFDDPRRKEVPAGDFLELRRTDPDQGRYLIGEDAEGVMWGAVTKGEHITPPRRHILRDVDRLLPVASDTFAPFESLGYGGLGIGWGLGAWAYSHAELRLSGLDAAAMDRAYVEVAGRIGVSGEVDDLAPYALGPLAEAGVLPAPPMDRNHTRVVARWAKHRRRLQDDGFHLGRSPLALLTEDRGERRRYAQRGMEFYDDQDRSAWRPWITVDELRRREDFTYLDGLLALRFAERDDHVELECLEVEGGGRRTLRGRRIVLAAGALGTARIALRSLTGAGTRLPLLCNPYAYVPCLQPGLVGRAAEERKMGFSQLSLVHDPDGEHADVAIAPMYSYQSLMLFRIVKQAPLDLVDAATLMRFLMPAFLIMGVQQPDAAGPGKHVSLVAADSPTGDALAASWVPSADEAERHRRRIKAYVSAMRRLGAHAIRAIDPGAGASIHYAGTLPFGERLAPDGRVEGTSRVFAADSSGFRFLPAKGLTLSIMANAHLVAERVLRG